MTSKGLAPGEKQDSRMPKVDIEYNSACEEPKCKDTDGDGGAHA